ncbi:MAG: peroxidase-related enzyme [Alphaproteobacteria bacterium]|nr:peroxidase-related enzyme [Alphaproteobacteria bacterium]
MPFLPSLRAGASLLDVFKMFPEASKPLIEFHEALLRGPSPFTEAERELIAAYVSRLNQCRYCHGVHTATAERLGIPQDAVQKLMDGAETSDVPKKMKTVLQYAQKLTESPAGVSQADAAAVLAVGWNETALYHTVAVTALFNLMNRLVEGLGIELDPAYVRPAAQRLADRGYLPLLEMIKR